MEKVKKHSTMISRDSQELEKVNVELKREIEERVCTEKALKESEDLRDATLKCYVKRSWRHDGPLYH